MVLLSLVFSTIFVFFFKQKTAYEMRISDGSSDVCSSDLLAKQEGQIFAVFGLDFPPLVALVKVVVAIGKAEPAIAQICNIAIGLLGIDVYRAADREIGRASCRARECQYV